MPERFPARGVRLGHGAALVTAGKMELLPLYLDFVTAMSMSPCAGTWGSQTSNPGGSSGPLSSGLKMAAP